MKKVILSVMLSGLVFFAKAQHMPRDTSGAYHNNNTSYTDSAKTGNQVFDGSKGKSRSQGDTLAHKKHAQHQSGTMPNNKSRMGSSKTNTATTSGTK